MRPMIYVAGPYSAPTPDGVQANIWRAQLAGCYLRRLGAEALVPHALSIMVERELPESEWIAVGLRHLERCDAIYVLRGWERSRGTLGEIARAKELGIPLFREEGDALVMVQWIQGWARSARALPTVRGNVEALPQRETTE